MDAQGPPSSTARGLEATGSHAPSCWAGSVPPHVAFCQSRSSPAACSSHLRCHKPHAPAWSQPGPIRRRVPAGWARPAPCQHMQSLVHSWIRVLPGVSACSSHERPEGLHLLLAVHDWGGCVARGPHQAGAPLPTPQLASRSHRARCLHAGLLVRASRALQRWRH